MFKKLGQRTNYVCASVDYLKNYGTPYSLSELTQHNCLMGSLDFWRFNENGKEKNIKVKGNIRYNNGVSLVDAALKGLGLVQLPDYYVQQAINDGQLIPVLQKFTANDGIWAVYPHNRHLSPKIKLLVDYLLTNMAK
jgi:DNA-binding transcriptional LysR family regulator